MQNLTHWKKNVVALALVVVLLTTATAGARIWPLAGLPEDSVPTYHVTPDEFRVFDDTVTEYMEDRGITAASLAVAVDGEKVWEQGYGWMNPHHEDTSPVVSPDTLFRLASISKPHINVVIHHLIEQGVIAGDDKAFCLPSTSGACHLSISPYNGVVGDGRLKDIEIRHLTSHSGGWDRAIFGDPAFMTTHIADSLGVPSPPEPEHVVSYMLAQELEFTPGARYAYSNLGYNVLGLIIEEVTGHDYVDMIKHVAHDVPLDQVGSAEEDGVDLEKGRTLRSDRNIREPSYHCSGFASHTYDPYRQAGLLTCWPDGAWSLRTIAGAGSLIASAPNVLELATDHWVWGPERDGSCSGCWGWHGGSLDGTRTMLHQRSDGLDYIIMLNKRWGSSTGHYNDVREVIDEAADAYMQQQGQSLSTAGQGADLEEYHVHGGPVGGHYMTGEAAYARR